MAKSDFDILLDRYMKDQLSADERKKMDAWLDVMKTGKVSHRDMTDAELQNLFERITGNVEADAITSFRPKSRHIFMTVWFRAAAALVVIGALSLLVWNFTRAKQIEKIALYDIEKITLSDGTLIWLHKGSKVTYTEDTDPIRHVELHGEALFEVAKDPAHPFTISSGTLLATVLGTSFNLKANDAKLELKVLTGNVLLSSPTDKQGVSIHPNQVITYAGIPSGEISPLQPSDVSAITIGTEYNMNFQHVNIAEVFAKLEKKFDIAFSFQDGQRYSCSVTADLTDRSLSSTLRLLAELINVEFKTEDKVVLVSGNGCN